jgi:hypothetical protein
VKISSFYATTLLLASTAACDEAIQEGWLVERTRVLGATVEAIDEPARASLSPGESGRVTFIVAAPRGTPNLAWSFAACLPPEGNFADPACETPVLAAGSGTTSGELVAMDIAVPPVEALGEAKELLLLAAFCSEGAPVLDPGTFTSTCGSGEPLLASLLVRLATAGANLNPPPPSVALGGAALLADETGESGVPCDAAPLAPVVAAGAQVDLVYVFDGAEREAGESILLSTFVTAGELDRQYSDLRPEETTPKGVRIAWTAPGADAAGIVVRFYVVLRDGRGGASFARFPVCVRAG